MRTPAAVVAVPALTGIAGGVILFERLPDLFGFCAAAAALLATFAALAWFGAGATAECVVAIVIGSGLAGLSLGASSADAAYNAPLLRWFTSRPAMVADEPVVLEGTLREDAALTASGVSIAIDVERVRTSRVARDRGAIPRRLRGGVRLSVAGAIAATHVGEWRAGRRVRVPALLRVPTTFRDPGIADDQRSLARRGIVLIGAVKSGALVEVIGRASFVREAAARFRARTRTRLAALVGTWSSRSGAIATAIVVGDRTGLSADDERRLQEAGTYHVIAISGGNIAILTFILVSLFAALRVPRRPAAAVVILVLLFYGLVTGGAASVGRAVAAAILYLTGRLLDHRGPPLNALAVAAILALMAFPLSATDSGFLLSFGATLGILTLAPRLSRALAAVVSGFSRTSDVASGFSRTATRLLLIPLTAAKALLIATVCAELVLAPLGALLFQRVTFAGLLLNFAAIPLMTLVQLGSMLALAADGIFQPVARWCGYVTHVSAAGLVDSALLVELAPWLSVHVAAPAAWLVIVYYCACTAAFVARAHAAAFWTIAGSVLALMVASPPFVARDPGPSMVPGAVRVVFLDVGQGDATLVRMPDGRTLLIDAGGLWSSQPLAAPSGSSMDPPTNAFDIGERVVGPTLRTMGVRHLDTLVLTHGDPDHIGGSAAVIRWFRPQTVWEGIRVPPFEPLRALAALASARRSVWRNVQAGDVERNEPVEIRVLHPPLPDWERQRVRNEDSIVLDVRIGDVSIVLSGDIGAEGERAILTRFAPARIVILKVPHHGSGTSSTPALLAALNPVAAIVSAGRDNRFGHPAPTVLARYRAANVPIFRTDHDGAVFIDTDGKRVWIRGWTGRAWESER